MSNRKIIAMMDFERRKERAEIELEWYRAIREFRGKLEQLEARIQRFEDGHTPRSSG